QESTTNTGHGAAPGNGLVSREFVRTTIKCPSVHALCQFCKWVKPRLLRLSSRPTAFPHATCLPRRSNPIQPLVEHEQSSGVVREVFDDIRATRQTTEINNFWKAIANHPPTLERTWATLKAVMAGPGELDPLVRELIYLAVSVTNGCDY